MLRVSGPRGLRLAAPAEGERLWRVLAQFLPHSGFLVSLLSHVTRRGTPRRGGDRGRSHPGGGWHGSGHGADENTVHR